MFRQRNLISNIYRAALPDESDAKPGLEARFDYAIYAHDGDSPLQELETGVWKCLVSTAIQPRLSKTMKTWLAILKRTMFKLCLRLRFDLLFEVLGRSLH